LSFVPLHERLKQRILDDITAEFGQKKGVRLPSERDLQTRYGVSRPTISKALAALAADGVLVRSSGRGRFVLGAVSSTALAADGTPVSTRRIGFIAPRSSAELIQRIFHGIDRAAHRRDCHVVLSSAGSLSEREEAVARDLIASGIQGLILYPANRRDDAVAQDYLMSERLGVPLILVDTCLPEHGHTQVIFDNRRVGGAMTSWLIGRGHSRIGLISVTEHLRHAPLAARLEGYKDALHDHGIAFDPDLVGMYEPLNETEEICALLDGWLHRPDRPTALIAPEDNVAMEIIEQLELRGIHVPEDVEVVGFDNCETARRFRPAFTTTSPDLERMGEIACELLLEAIDNGGLPPRTYVLDVPLTVRSTKNPSGKNFLPVPDELIKKGAMYAQPVPDTFA
jgi:DNA-binding LacI/PurR family transcriptional regulator